MTTRRIRVCNCPFCAHVTPVHPVREGLAATICVKCLMAFRNEQVASWLTDSKNPAEAGFS